MQWFKKSRNHIESGVDAELTIIPHCTEFQLLHSPATFHAERMAWRSVIYMNLVRSIRRYLCLVLRSIYHDL